MTEPEEKPRRRVDSSFPRLILLAHHGVAHMRRCAPGVSGSGQILTAPQNRDEQY